MPMEIPSYASKVLEQANVELMMYRFVFYINCYKNEAME